MPRRERPRENPKGARVKAGVTDTPNVRAQAPLAPGMRPRPSGVEIGSVICGLFAFITLAIWGFTAWPFPWSIVAGIGAPVLAIAVWALFVSPRAVLAVHPSSARSSSSSSTPPPPWRGGAWARPSSARVRDRRRHVRRSERQTAPGVIADETADDSPSPRAPDRALALLRAELGARVDTSPASLDAARADKSGHAAEGLPLAVVHAASVSDVQAVMRIATATRTPVVPRGAGTGLAGGANTGGGEISLSVRGMDRVLEVRPDDLLAVVEPGILNADLNAQLEPHGVWWAPDPASRAISTVGGNIATGAGGLLCAKYGVVRDAVLGVDLVLADGRLLHLGHRSVKGVTGLDLTSLVIGSEGTLGVVVGATLKLRRLVEGERVTLTALFEGVGPPPSSRRRRSRHPESSPRSWS